MTGKHQTTDRPEASGAATPARRNDARGSGVTFARVVRSEWIKLRTLRSTVWSFATIVLLTVLFGALLALTYDPAFDPSVGPGLDQEGQNANAVSTATLGVNFTQLVAAVLGVLIISGEYSTGMIRSTLTAVPRRLPALWAKALVLTVSTFVIGLLSIVATALITLPILWSKDIEPELLDGTVLRTFVGGAGYLALIALLAFGFGAVLRSSAGGIASAVGLILVVPTVLSIVSVLTQATWLANLSSFLPSNAGARMFAFDPGAPDPFAAAGADASDIITLDATQGTLVLLAWIVVVLAAGAVLLKRRDA